MEHSGYDLAFGLVTFGPVVILAALVQRVIYELVASKWRFSGWKLHLAFLGVGLIGVDVLLLFGLWLLGILFGKSLAAGPGVILWGMGTFIVALSTLGWLTTEALLLAGSLLKWIASFLPTKRKTERRAITYTKCEKCGNNIETGTECVWCGNSNVP